MPWRHQTRSCSRRPARSEEHTSELQSLAYLVCRLLLEKKKTFVRPTYIRPRLLQMYCCALVPIVCPPEESSQDLILEPAELPYSLIVAVSASQCRASSS